MLKDTRYASTKNVKMQGYVQLLIANYQIIKQNEHTMKDVNHDALAKITHVIICDIIFDK